MTLIVINTEFNAYHFSDFLNAVWGRTVGSASVLGISLRDAAIVWAVALADGFLVCNEDDMTEGLGSGLREEDKFWLGRCVMNWRPDDQKMHRNTASGIYRQGPAGYGCCFSVIKMIDRSRSNTDLLHVDTTDILRFQRHNQPDAPGPSMRTTSWTPGTASTAHRARDNRSRSWQSHWKRW